LKRAIFLNLKVIDFLSSASFTASAIKPYLEEISSAVRINSENSQQASRLTMQCQENVEHSRDVVARAIDAIDEVSKSSNHISDIINLIDEIAFQTNILALNASIEAARAGDAGKGFAVVADTVRTLAKQTDKASKQIRGLISTSNAHVKNGVMLINQSGEALEHIKHTIDEFSLMMKEIANATIEQSAGLEQVNIAISMMDEMTQQNRILAETNNQAAHELRDQSQTLIQSGGFFQL
jgi:methyl-accepting chemotaxis protein